MSADLACTDAERERMVEHYADYLGRLADQLGEKVPEWTPAGAILAAQQITGEAIGRALTEAALRIRHQRGLPSPDPEALAEAMRPEEDGAEDHETHAERARAEGARMLRLHDGNDNDDPDLEGLEYLLVDLMHWCEDSGHFDEALECARSHFQAECEEDHSNGDGVEERRPLSEEQRREFLDQQLRQTERQRQLAKLRQYQPRGFDA